MRVELVQVGVVELLPRAGAATVGRNRPRREYGAIVVLFWLFWLQSMSTRPSRSVFFMLDTISSG